LDGTKLQLTSILRMSIDNTVVKKNIWRKKSEPRPSTANRQNSCQKQPKTTYGVE